MDILNTILRVSYTALTNVVFVISMYYLCISFFGIYRKKENNDTKPVKSFALLVAAHNEETVIQDIVVSLKRLDYPKELYDIFVIADNCSDNTALKAREAGAIVCERFNKTKKGKGYALEWMFDRLFKMEKKYDSVVIFDADNLASKNFLKEMNKKLCEGYKVVQGYLDSKNPTDTWITGSYSISFWTSNRMFQLSRRNLGLSNQLGGTGFCIDTTILKELGWGATCLTEDLEFTCKLVLNGYKVGWAHEAVIYDEKPLGLAQSWWQRKRWMQGFADVSSRYFFKLLKKAIKERSITALDCALYSIQPIVTILLGLAMILSGIDKGMNFMGQLDKIQSGAVLNSLNVAQYNLITIVALLVGILQFIYTPFILVLEKKLNFKIFIYYLLYPVYAITWLPISIQGIIDRNKKEWSHTVHTRSVNITDLEKVN
ncbi:glycosyltransferase family 2 protein [Clostridium omnivorum]|uniref:Glycosyl transferase family 2 n=1 Tax=Clostridium omnivorum TaxID=1604902 RepID=A0ABQ5NC48_9CLOT|nr:glycosyltransferase family 2 protein [Clostridium sp. E14]GLC32848.1 glycosyl transferase family 2 [Clostridium sp. E14]